jgi:hypothetical protein
MGETRSNDFGTSGEGHSLSQDSFFFCAVKNIGDLPGAECIYVETVVDSDSGVAFAKVYSAKSTLNAVDILANRVLPYFDRRGVAIREIHTPHNSEYCGLISVHPYETFLATSHIGHLPVSHGGHSHLYLCEQFYSFLLRAFLQSALRKKFQVSLDELQGDLDTFVERYNSMQRKQNDRLNWTSPPSPNFPVDL